MKEIFSLILGMGVCFTFSFYKMSQNEHKVVKENSNHNLYEGSCIYIDYIYNNNLQYGLFYDLECVESLCHKTNKELLVSKEFNQEDWKKSLFNYEYEIFHNTHTEKIKYGYRCFYVKDIEKQNNFIDELSKIVDSCDYTSNKYINVTTHKDWTSGSKIEVRNTEKVVELIDSTERAIDFQKAFKNYVRKQKSLYDDNIFQYVNQFIRDLNNPILNKENQIKTSAISKIMNISKITYTDDQVELLENSEILAIWSLPPKKYNNKDYIESEKLYNPNAIVKEAQSKIINQIIIGFAVDKRDNTTFHWVTDLGKGQDISVLFDYADELK